MVDYVRRFLVVGLCLSIAAPVCFAQEEPAAADEEAEIAEVEERVENRLLRLTTLEDAFLQADRRRRQYATFVIQETARLRETEDEEQQAEIRRNIGAARKRLADYSTAMEVVFGIGRRRDYEYNQVTSTVYLRVGTVEESFARAVRARDALLKFIGEQRALAEAETDEATKAEIEQKIDAATRQYQTVAASLQLVFGVVPQRNYMYHPQNSTLYLRITEDELTRIRGQLAERARAAEAEEAGGGEEDVPAGADEAEGGNDE
jgi:hypothetical protein